MPDQKGTTLAEWLRWSAWCLDLDARMQKWADSLIKYINPDQDFADPPGERLGLVIRRRQVE